MTWQQYVLFGLLVAIVTAAWNCAHHLEGIHETLIYLRDVERARRNEKG